jgi:hypothetical protein
MSHKDFTVHHRAIGRAAAWAAFFVGQVYAIASLLGFLSLKSPQDPIGDPFLSIMALLLILLAPCMVVCMIAVHAYASPDRKVYSATALAFMLLAAGITSCVNFSVLTVSSHIVMTSSSWLPLFLPYKWPAVAYALDILAWDWFFALSMLAAAPVFKEGRLAKMVQILLIISGVLCLVGLIGIPFDEVTAISVGIIGYGVVAPIVFLLIAIVFGRTQPVISDTEK